MRAIRSINILGVNVSDITYELFTELVSNCVSNGRQSCIGYANAHTLNRCFEDSQLKELLNGMDFVHPDGIGVFKASRYLYETDGLSERMTGSDFYPVLAGLCEKEGWKVFFFGHKKETLSKILAHYPNLRIAGLAEGYGFEDEAVVSEINASGADILLVGLSFPRQEMWISSNRQKLSPKVILAVGDGFRVFSGEKVRGPAIFRKLGLEWLIRLLLHPVRDFRRYFVGVPLFIARIIRQRKSQNC